MMAKLSLPQFDLMDEGEEILSENIPKLLRHALQNSVPIDQTNKAVL